MSDGDLARFRAAVAGGLAHLESRRQEVNDLNVFPVADGDTGDNMALTLRAVLVELDVLLERHGETPIDAIGRSEIVESVARAALLGARGNSGVILSQLVRGAAAGLDPCAAGRGGGRRGARPPDGAFPRRPTGRAARLPRAPSAPGSRPRQSACPASCS